MAPEPPRALGSLPAHFRREQEQLNLAGVTTWQALAALHDLELRRLAGSGAASEQRLIKLRGQARLVVAVGLAPNEAALLLHAGIADRSGLANADPHQLQRALGRLQRSLTGRAMPRLDMPVLHSWIRRARQGPGRPTN